MTRMNNKGLTLVELICTIALFSLIGLAAMSMMTVVAKMNHAVALQEKQAREAEVVIETVKYQLLRNPSRYESGTIYVETTPEQEARSIIFDVKAEDGRYNLYMRVTTQSAPENESGPESLLASDLAATDGFSIAAEMTDDLMEPKVLHYTITLKYENGNEFQWIISPRLDP